MKPEIQTYRPTSAKTILLVVVSLAFVVGGAFMTQDEPVMGWFVTLFFGLCLLVFVVQLIPGSTELTLTEDGFEMTNLFRKTTTKWSDVKSFRIGFVGRNKSVMFDYVDRHNEFETGKAIAKELSGSHGGLPSTYGLKASELLDIMNEWKNKYDCTTKPKAN